MSAEPINDNDDLVVNAAAHIIRAWRDSPYQCALHTSAWMHANGIGFMGDVLKEIERQVTAI